MISPVTVIRKITYTTRGGRTMKTSKLFRTIIMIMILLLACTALSARVVASKTLTIYGSIPQRTTVSFDANGFPVLSSNSIGTELAVVEQTSDSYLFQVTAP